jgi:hypothetical protein
MASQGGAPSRLVRNHERNGVRWRDPRPHSLDTAIEPSGCFIRLAPTGYDNLVTVGNGRERPR